MVQCLDDFDRKAQQLTNCHHLKIRFNKDQRLVSKLIPIALLSRNDLVGRVVAIHKQLSAIVGSDNNREYPGAEYASLAGILVLIFVVNAASF